MKAEQFIQDHTRNCCNEIGYCHNKTRNHNHVFYNWLTPDHARMAVQIAREEAIEEACQYIKDNLYKYLFVCDGQAGFPTAEFIKYLKSAMEEQV